MPKSNVMPSVLSPTSLQIAWAAGLYEGEGCICRHKNSVILSVTQTASSRWILDRMRKLFGGSISSKGGGFKNGRPVLMWQACGSRARGFIYTIYSYLSPRRKSQARIALGLVG